MSNRIEISVNAPELVSAINALSTAIFSTGIKLVDSTQAEGGKENDTTLIGLIGNLHGICKEMTSEEVSEQKAATPTQTPKPTVTIEQIRSMLAKKSQAGKTADVRELLGKFGATKLSEIKQDSFPELLKAAEEL